MGILGFVVVVFTGVVLLYLAFTAYYAKTTVASAPREDMYLCDKHGALHKKHVLKLTGYTEKPIEICPLCYRDREKSTKK